MSDNYHETGLIIKSLTKAVLASTEQKKQHELNSSNILKSNQSNTQITQLST